MSVRRAGTEIATTLSVAATVSFGRILMVFGGRSAQRQSQNGDTAKA